MLDADYLNSRFILNPPATPDDIEAAASRIASSLPREYVGFLLLCNGLRSLGCLALHPVEILPDRNKDYEVPASLPGYFMIGDDGGGQAILIDGAGQVFEVGMGVMSANCLEASAGSIEDLLVNKGGLTLGER